MSENKKIGYDTAIKLTDKMERTIWSVYIALLASNAFLLTFAAFLVPYYKFSSIPETALIKLVSILGTLICVAWFLITMRNFDYNNYYFAWARKFEEEAFGDDVTMIRKGAVFAKGNEIEGLGDVVRLRWCSRLFKVEGLIYVVILTFLAIYIYLFFS